MFLSSPGSRITSGKVCYNSEPRELNKPTKVNWTLSWSAESAQAQFFKEGVTRGWILWERPEFWRLVHTQTSNILLRKTGLPKKLATVATQVSNTWARSKGWWWLVGGGGVGCRRGGSNPPYVKSSSFWSPTGKYVRNGQGSFCIRDGLLGGSFKAHMKLSCNNSNSYSRKNRWTFDKKSVKHM